MTIDPDSLAVLALTNRLVDAGVAPLKASEIWRLLGCSEHPSTLAGLEQRELAAVLDGSGLDPERVARLLDTGVGLAVRVEALYERGISVLAATDARYPTRLAVRLGPAAPAVLYCAGDLTLLATDGIGIAGAPGGEPAAGEIAAALGARIAVAGVPVVSGGAAGADEAASSAAHGAGGTSVAVLAGSLERAIGTRAHRSAVLAGRAVVCTPYHPGAASSEVNAIGRTKIVYGLSRVTVVVTASDGASAAWSGAREALERGFGRVAVWQGVAAGPDRDGLVAAGAVPVDRIDDVLSL